MTERHPSNDLLFKWVETHDGYLFVTELDVRDCGHDDGRTGLPIVSGFSYNERYEDTGRTWEYSDLATAARWVPADIKKKVRTLIGREYNAARANAKKAPSTYAATYSKHLAKAYRLSVK